MLTPCANVRRLHFHCWSIRFLKPACCKEIDEIEEMEDLCEIIKSFGLSTKGIKGVDN